MPHLYWALLHTALAVFLSPITLLHWLLIELYNDNSAVYAGAKVTQPSNISFKADGFAAA
jgi:hypothetical protein